MQLCGTKFNLIEQIIRRFRDEMLQRAMVDHAQIDAFLSGGDY
jgi:hypothetical protein